jgi:acyl carrier protein
LSLSLGEIKTSVLEIACSIAGLSSVSEISEESLFEALGISSVDKADLIALSLDQFGIDDELSAYSSALHVSDLAALLHSRALAIGR